MAFVGHAITGFLPFRSFSTKSGTSLRQIVLQDRCSLVSTRLHWHSKTGFLVGVLTKKNEEQISQEDESDAFLEDDEEWQDQQGENEEQILQEDESGELPEDDEEWQAQQRQKTKEWHAYRKKEEEEEERRTNEYREIGMRLKAYPQEDVRKARILVSEFITAGEDIEERIEEAAEKGELNELVLMVIWNRLDVAKRDEETDVVRSLDLLYRRIETEILKRESTPSMRLLNELLNLHDGYDDDGWMKKCRNLMLETFAREDSFSIFVPAGVNLQNDQGQFELPPEKDDALLRIDFIRGVDALLKEVRSAQGQANTEQGLDPESVAARLKQQEKQRTIYQVESLLKLAVSLKW